MVEVDVTFVFDEVLSRHMERLFGSRQGIGGLQLGIGTIACLTLLADQPERGEPATGEPATETADQAANEKPAAGQCSAQTLEGKLAELGFRDKEKAQSLIEEMREKGYIVEDEHGRITGGKPALSMARLLERIFPKLPGKTLVAYFIQTVDEVLTGRKAAEVALAHFDQTLKKQGVPLKPPKPEKPSGGQTAARKEGTLHVFKEVQAIPKSTPGFIPPEEEKSGGFRIIGSPEDGFRYKLRDVQKPSPSPAEAPAESTPPVSTDKGLEEKPPAEAPPADQPVCTRQPHEEQPFPTDSQPAPPSEEQGENPAQPERSFSGDLNGSKDDSPEQEKRPGQAKDEPENLQGEHETPPAEGMARPDGIAPSWAEGEPGEPEETADALIEREIAGFQNELASLCPLCKEGSVREEKTETGKLYYKCTNKACNLVSWGRPHHVACPVCSNPFLIEVSSEEGKVSLQCPRATCRYQSSLSGDSERDSKKSDSAPGRRPADSGTGKPRRRVVRRRLVRKKK